MHEALGLNLENWKLGLAECCRGREGCGKGSGDCSVLDILPGSGDKVMNQENLRPLLQQSHCLPWGPGLPCSLATCLFLPPVRTLFTSHGVPGKLPPSSAPQTSRSLPAHSLIPQTLESRSHQMSSPSEREPWGI